MDVVALVGNPQPESRTLAAAQCVLEVLTATYPVARRSVVDLATMAADLAATDSPQLRAAHHRVTNADVLVVISPTYKGTYTGLLKLFLDGFPGAALAGVCALPLLVMGTARHALAVEVHLRPLLVELGAQVPTPGLALLEEDLGDPRPVISRWLDQVGASLPVTSH